VIDPLITAADLAELVERGAPLVVLDVRWRLLGPPASVDYEQGHLPGAVFVDLDTDLAGLPGEHGRHPLPSRESFEMAMRRCGVTDAVPVVCYDVRDATSAARAWWLLRYYGHRNVRVLDGGFDAWLAAGGPTSTDVPVPATGDFTATSGGMPLLDADRALQVATDGTLLDARSPERFRGEAEPIDLVAGHIPGAVSAPNSGNVNADGTLLPRDELQARFTRLGIADGDPVGAYCGSGVTATQHVLALEVAGIEAALYADSWSGWITDPKRPVTTGE
jgi:thiosulfate/3-mercaptopyruvate sulfurtransferase